MTGILEWAAKISEGIKLWAIVRPWERGVRVRKGKNAKNLDPGIYLRIPLLDEVLIVNTRLRLAAVPGQTLTTADRRTVSIASNIQFRIEDPLRAMLTMQQPEDSCAGFAQAITAAYVAARSLDEIDPADLQAEMTEELLRITEGIAFEHVAVTEFAVVGRTYRVLGNEWRPMTRPDVHDKDV